MVQKKMNYETDLSVAIIKKICLYILEVLTTSSCILEATKPASKHWRPFEAVIFTLIMGMI